MVPILLHCLLSACTSGLSWPQGISLVYRLVYTTCRDHPKVDSAAIQPLSGTSLKDSGEKKFPIGQNFKMCISFTLLGKTNDQSWWQGNLEKRHLWMVKYLYSIWMFTKGWPQQTTCSADTFSKVTASFCSHSCPHPTGSWTDYVLWQRWKSHLSSATWTSTHQGHTIYGPLGQQ